MLMVIKRLYIKGYERLFLNNITEFEYKPENLIQIILGTNGSGKSSILRELTPLPSDLKNDYTEDGYKIIDIDHNNSIYNISSGYKVKNKHSFIKDGVELNQGGTKKIQLHLVKEHFNITPYVHEVLLGNINITTMGIQERKNWFTNISNIDYTYPISVYNRLKSRHRDIVGGIKIINNKVLEDKALLLNNEEIIKINSNIHSMRSIIDELLISKTPNKSKHDVNLEKMDSLTNLLEKMLPTYVSMSGIDNIDQKLSKTESELSLIKNRITSLKDTLNKIHEEEELAKKSKEMETLVKDKSVLLEELRKLSILNTMGLDLSSIDSINDLFRNTLPDVNNILSEIDTSEVYWDVGVFKETFLKHKEQEIILNNKRKELDLLSKEIDILENAKKTTHIVCSNCNHEWYSGYDEDKHNSILKDCELLEKTVNDKTSIVDNLSKSLETLNMKKDLLLRLKVFKDNYPLLKPIWTYIEEKYDIQKDTNSIISFLNETIFTLESLLPYNEKNIRLEELDKRISLLNISRDTQLGIIDKNKNELEEELAILLQKSNKLDILFDNLNKYKVTKDRVETIVLYLKTSIKKLHTNTKVDYLELKNDTINKIINSIRQDISELELKVNEANRIKSNYEKTNLELEDLKEREIVLKSLVNIMSPTSGLIAKSINSFLNKFLKEINTIINSIWSYDMVLLPCLVTDDNDLDYKFRVRVDGKKTISDISKLSSSMKEIVDLATKIVSMKYLGLKDTPLILDEFGRTMDPKHRTNAYNIINQVMVSNFKQIFIVSHFESMYGSFKNSDITILSDENMLLSEDIKYNTIFKTK
jgi:DNA repair exonuclease SbcCD ATPase subunit